MLADTAHLLHAAASNDEISDKELKMMSLNADLPGLFFGERRTDHPLPLFGIGVKL